MGPVIHWVRARHADADERGAELVEFAIVMVILVALVYGIAFFGVLLASKVSLTQAAADGARAGVVYSTPASAEAAAEARAAQDLSWLGKGTCNPTNAILTCTATEAPCTENTSTTCLTVSVDYVNYGANGLIPGELGLSILSPSNIVSRSTLQLSSLSS